MICSKCNIDKDIINFHYRKDCQKYRKECKECFNLKSKESYYKNRLNNDFKEKERKRGLEKYYRLYSKSLKKRNKYSVNQSHKLKYPEKHIAVGYTKKLRLKGFHCHHWNYNKEYYKDIIYLTQKDHLKAHRFLIYDEDKFIYKTIDGDLLDTKEKHLEYIINKINSNI